MDIFCEYMVAHRKGIKEFLINVLVLFLAIFLTLNVVMNWRLLSAVAFLLIVGIWYGAVYLLKKTSIEYEYILTNEILDIDKITAKQSRKRMISINLKEIEAFEKKTSANVSHVKVIDYTGYINAENVYMIDTLKNGERVRILFQPSPKMLGFMHQINPNLIPKF